MSYIGTHIEMRNYARSVIVVIVIWIPSSTHFLCPVVLQAGNNYINAEYSYQT